MKRCPNCGKFDVEYDPFLGMERCLWRDCRWVNVDNIDVDEVPYPLNFIKFRNNLKPKTKMAP